MSGEERRVAPTALISWAHNSDAREQAQDDAARQVADHAWKTTVLNFMAGLRVHGDVDAHVDVAYSSHPIDWSRWGPSMARDSDFVLAVVNKAWARRFDGTEAPTRGAGAVAEADELLGLFNRDRDAFDRKVIPVVLPGASEQDLPDRLRGRLTHFRVDRFDEAGLEPLLRRIHGKPEHPLPPLRGSMPSLPPAVYQLAGPPEPPRTSTSPSPATAISSRPLTRTAAPPESGRLAAVGEAELLNRLEVIDSGLRALPPDAANDNLALPWARHWHQLMSERALVADELRHRHEQPPHSGRHPVPAATLLEQARRHLRPLAGAWLIVVAAPERVVANDEARLSVEETRQRLQQWHTNTAPVPGLDLATVAYRAAGRVVFTGEPTNIAAGDDDASSRWRIELDDSGGILLAVALPDPPHPEGGQVGWAGQPGEVVFDADLVLPVRRDALEIWTLTALNLVGEHQRDLPDDLKLDVRAQLVPLDRPTPAGHHHLRRSTMQLVDSGCDPDDPHADPSRAPGSRDLPIEDVSPAGRVWPLQRLRDPASRVRAARLLALSLLEHFGVEDTAVLQSDGTLQPRRAAVHDQQPLHQHAQRLGLKVDEFSPADRLQQAEELRAQARDLLAPP